MIRVILFKDVADLGKTGDVITVKDGYARNFLLPQQIAHLATPANLKRIEQQKFKEVALAAEAKQQAEDLAKRLEKVSCTVAVEVNDLDKLYGSVSEIDIAKALETEGHSIDRKLIFLEKPIEELGIYEVPIKLHPEVMAKIRLWVTKK